MSGSDTSITLNGCVGMLPTEPFISGIKSIINLHGIYVAYHQDDFLLENK